MEPSQVIVVGLGSAGDVHPNVGLALALRKRGHGVILVAGAVFGPLAQRLGLDFVELLTEDEYDAAIRDPDLWHPVRSFSVVARRLILPGLRVMYDIIEKNYKARSDRGRGSGPCLRRTDRSGETRRASGHRPPATDHVAQRNSARMLRVS